MGKIYYLIFSIVTLLEVTTFAQCKLPVEVIKHDTPTYLIWQGLSDSKKELIRKAATDSAQIVLLNNWALNSAGDSSVIFASLAEFISRHCKNTKGLAQSLIRKGVGKKDLGSFFEARRLIKEGISIAESIQDSALILSGCVNLGRMERNGGDYNSAHLFYKKALEHLTTIPDRTHFIIYTDLTYLNSLSGDYDRVISFFRKGEETFSQLKSKMDIVPRDIELEYASLTMHYAQFLQEIRGDLYQAKKLLNKALSKYESLGDIRLKALCLINLGNNAYHYQNLELAREYYNQALSFQEFLVPNDIAIILKNKGRVFLERYNSKSDSSIICFKRAMKIFAGLNNQRELAFTQWEIGNYYFELGKLDTAAKHYKSSLQFKHQDSILIGQIYYFLNVVYAELGHKYINKSRKYGDLFLKLSDQMNPQKRRNLIGYLMEKERQQRIFLQSIAKVEELKANVFRSFAIILGLMVGLALFVIINIKQTSRLKLAELKEMLGRDLHGKISNKLYTTRNIFPSEDNVRNSVPQNSILIEQYSKSMKMLSYVLEQTRQLSHFMANELSLQKEIENFRKLVEVPGKLDVDLVTYELDKGTGDSIRDYSILGLIEEIVSNAILHACVKSSIEIGISNFKDSVSIEISDDGNGVNWIGEKLGEGLGLKNINKYLYICNGKITGEFIKGERSTVFITIRKGFQINDFLFYQFKKNKKQTV